MSDFFKDGFFDFLDDRISKDTEFIPLLTSEEEEKMNKDEIPESLPILPIRNNVLFPGVVMPITVGRDKSIKLIQDAYQGNKMVGVVSQKKQDVDDPDEDDLYKMGTSAQILKLLKMPDGSTTAIMQGKKRFEWNNMQQKEPYFVAKVDSIVEEKINRKSKEFHALFDSLRDLSIQIINQSPNIPSDAGFAIKNIESPTFLVHFISSNMEAEVSFKQDLLEEKDLFKRAKKVLKQLSLELQLLEMKNEIQSKVKGDIDKQQREYFLNQQMKTIQEELGGGPNEQDIKTFREKAKKKKWTQKEAGAFEKELEKLQRMNPQGPEYSVQMNYLDTLVELPWRNYSKDKFDLKKARKILDRDHFGLEKVKDRIIEYLAVLKLKGDMKSPILCLYGPPGVGKTSLGKSIAEAMGRKYVRMSLGGLHDESEIRGHRRTYIGAMPGRVLQNLKKAGTSNPVFVLDEVDKVGRSAHGDPSSALLEVLDPEQNSTFNDNFVELDYDLSKVLFIATANDLSTVQPPLRDRMELIEVTGYSVEEKVQIALKHLIPKQAEAHGLKRNQFGLDARTLQYIIEEHTAESGVRNLEQKIAKLARNRAKDVAIGVKTETKFTREQIEKLLGVSHPKEKYIGNDFPGVVAGLAWSQFGGSILYIEASLSKGNGKLTLTGNLGDIMKESATLAYEYLKARPKILGIHEDAYEKWNVHIHVPEGATPKDGPSAGVTILTALASAYTGKKVKKYLAMTGEITLRGAVLPVGGIKEKILAAKRAGIKEIILSSKNEKDILEVKKEYLKGLKFHYVNTMNEVLEAALINKK